MKRLGSWVLLVAGCASNPAPGERGGPPAADASVADASSRDAGSDAPDLHLPYRRPVFAALYASDPLATYAWYRDVLGLLPGPDGWFVMKDGSTVEILPGGTAAPITKPPKEQSVTLGLQVPDLDAASALLESRGFAFLGPASSTPGEDRWRYFADPEGNRLELKDVGTPRAGSGYEALPWVGVYVQDHPAMAAWYRDVLGLVLRDLSPFYAVFRLDGGGFVELFPNGTARSTPKSAAEQPIVPALEVPDVEQARAVLTARGVGGWSSTGPWANPLRPDERAVEFSDPEGNRWLLEDYGGDR